MYAYRCIHIDIHILHIKTFIYLLKVIKLVNKPVKHVYAGIKEPD